MKKLALLLLFLSIIVSATQADSIHEAAISGDTAAIKSLIKKNPALINSADKEGATPLHHASAKNKLDIVKLLIELKADVNAAKKDGVTPLHIASSLGFYEIAEVLIKNKANVNAKDKSGRTPLDIAESKKHSKIVELLKNAAAANSAKADATRKPNLPPLPMLAGKENTKQNSLPPLKPDEVLPLAKKYVALLSAGEYKAVYENFDASLQKTITLDGVIMQWEALSAECGKYIRQNEAQALKVQQYVTVIIPCDFENDKRVIRFTFNREKKIIGFFIEKSVQSKEEETELAPPNG